MGRVSNAYGSLAGQTDLAQNEIANPDPLLTTLRTQASDELALGRTLSEEQIRESQQAARAGFNARGMATGPQSLFTEVLNRDRFGTARQDQRRAFAGQVFGMGLQNDAMNQSRRGFLLSASNAQLSPVLSAIYGNRSAVSTSAPAAAMAGAPQIAGAQDTWSTMFNANAAQQISSANNNAALLGAGISTASQLGSQYMQTQQANAQQPSTLPAYSAPMASNLSYRPANMPIS
jgi:hypothetical protein